MVASGLNLCFLPMMWFWWFHQTVTSTEALGLESGPLECVKQSTCWIISQGLKHHFDVRTGVVMSDDFLWLSETNNSSITATLRSD